MPGTYLLSTHLSFVNFLIAGTCYLPQKEITKPIKLAQFNRVDFIYDQCKMSRYTVSIDVDCRHK